MRTSRIRSMCLLTFVLPLLVGAEAPATAASAPTAVAPAPLQIPAGMKQYVIGLLVRGPKYTQDQTPERQAKLAEHLAYIHQMITAKKYVLAGPCLDDSKLGGLLIISVPTVAEAQAITDQDPFVRAGQYTMELHPAMLPDLGAVKVTYPANAPSAPAPAKKKSAASPAAR